MRRSATTVVLAAAVALVVFVIVTVLDGGHSHDARNASSGGTPYAAYFPRAPHVLSTTSIYSLSTPPPLPTFPALVPSRLDAPVAKYRTYSAAQLGLMEHRLATLQGALAANDRPAAEVAWRAAYTDYLRLGAVYLVGPAATLNQEIDGTAGGVEGGVSSPRFTGLHRIEYGLWTGAPPRALLGTERRLDVAVRKLRRMLPGLSITPLEYATRAHEILEDAQRDLLSGADVPWSGEGPLATDAGLQATKEVISTLKPLLNDDEGTFRLMEHELTALSSTMNSIAAAHGGRLPANGQLTQSQAELLDGALGGALEALSQVPGRLEVEVPAHVAPIPEEDVKIDP
jgi:iron uptake system EfeUOB component EfeO/EfeM